MNFCVALYIFCFLSFYVLFVCKRVLYFCHRVTNQLQLTNISLQENDRAGSISLLSKKIKFRVQGDTRHLKFSMPNASKGTAVTPVLHKTTVRYKQRIFY